jgi:hypothetical protein
MLHRQFSRKALIFCLLVFSLLLICIAAYRYQWWPFQSSTPSTIINTPEKTTNVSPKNTVSPDKADAKAIQNQTTDQVPTPSDATLRLTQLTVGDSDVLVSSVITNPPAGAGTCVVTFSNPNDRPITKQFEPSIKDGTAFCSTHIPTYEFSYLGNWSVTAYYYADNQKVSAEGTLQIQ